MADPTGQSPSDHEGTNLEPDERDDEVLTLTRGGLRILVRTMLNLKLRDHVRLDTITPEEIAR